MLAPQVHRATRAAAGSLTGVRGVLAVIVVLAAGLAALLPGLEGDGPLEPARALPGWVLAVMFGTVELCVLHVQVRREAQTVSLHEIPLVLGMFLAAPATVVLARVLGAAPVLLLHRRQAPLKAGYNLVLFATDTAVALTVFRLVPVRAVTAELTAWPATFAAVVAGGALAAVATTLAIAAFEGSLDVREVGRDVLQDAVRAVAVATLALIAVYALSLSTTAALPLLAAAGVVLLAYRAYASLSERHLALERLYRFSQAVSSTPEMEGVLRSVLREARELLRAERACVVVLPPAGGPAARVELTSSDRLVRSEEEVLLLPGQVHAQVVETGTAELVGRGTREPAHRRLLAELEAREAVVVPLRGDAGVVGTLTVTDRLGDVRTFDAADVRLLETVANHASVALQNGRLLDQLRYDAAHDALTGLPNRVRLQRELQEALDAVAAGRRAGLAVLVLDLDGFKDVNDTLGHAQGDRLLQEVARRLVDAVGEAGTVARLGGDEFAVLLGTTEEEQAVLRVGRRVLHALEQPIVLDRLEVEVGASIGAALAPLHGTEVSVLLKCADVAMYAAKGSTRGLRVYEPEHDGRDVKRLTLVAELRTALAEGGLEVHVQPQARFRDGEVVSVEALVRWQHPTLGSVPPDEFIPVAERSGLIAPLTTFVLDASLAAAAGWRAAGHDVGVAVNLSTRSLLDVDLVEDVRRLLRRHGLRGSALTLEITESGVMADPARAVALLLELRDLGVRLSVDDFGTGYSSLSYLKRLPVHEVKIDKSFVLSLRSDSDDQAIARSIVDLGRHLGLDIVAEGVEDAETWDLLSGMGCTLAQGWHLARPMPVAALPAWLDARARATRGAASGAVLRAV